MMAEKSEKVSEMIEAESSNPKLLFKDAILDRVSEVANVAQFVSFSPNLENRHSRIRGIVPNHSFPDLHEAVEALLNAAPDQSVNVRSFTPENPKSREFIYGIGRNDEVVSAVRRLAASGLYTIVNETVDVHDGGVSGVALGDIIEIAPEDTPRCVEKEGTVSFSHSLGLEVLERVYHFRPALEFGPEMRVEFSLHPLRRGVRHDHTIVWELETIGPTSSSADTRWPNRFSRFLGDKAFGLLMAEVLGLPVPSTTVFGRFLPPFSFGQRVGTAETWIRTCPVVQDPGHFTTQRGWCDPFKLMADEDPQGTLIASVLAQEGIDAAFSGSLIVQADGEVKIEGTQGYGDQFMVGKLRLVTLPGEITKRVHELYERASEKLGPVRMEWVYDKSGKAWIVQIHRGATTSQGSIIHPGQATFNHEFDVSRGLDELRELIARVQGSGQGIVLVGQVGVTSHLGDLLRKAEIPSRIEQG